MTWIQNIENHPYKGMLVKIIENPAIVCMAKDCGMDFLFYDLEHLLLRVNNGSLLSVQR